MNKLFHYKFCFVCLGQTLEVHEWSLWWSIRSLYVSQNLNNKIFDFTFEKSSSRVSLKRDPIQYDIAYSTFKLLRWHINWNLYSQQMPHISPSRASYGVPTVRNLEKIYGAKMAPHCTYRVSTNDSDSHTLWKINHYRLELFMVDDVQRDISPTHPLWDYCILVQEYVMALFNYTAFEGREWMSNYIPLFYVDVGT